MPIVFQNDVYLSSDEKKDNILRGQPLENMKNIRWILELGLPFKNAIFKNKKKKKFYNFAKDKIHWAVMKVNLWHGFTLFHDNTSNSIF